MGKLSFIIIVLIFIVSSAFGQKGIYVEQKVNTSGVMGQPSKESISKTWSLDDRMRIDSDEQFIILRFDLKKVWTIMPKQKQYMEMDIEQINQMAKMGAAMLQGKENIKFTFKKTGATKKIKNWSCYEIIAKFSTMTQKMWLTEDLPFGKDIYYKYFKNMPEAKKLAESIYNSKELKGYPVYTETIVTMMGMEIKSSSELVTIREEKISKSLFELPKGLKKIDNPLMQMQQGNFE